MNTKEDYNLFVSSFENGNDYYHNIYFLIMIIVIISTCMWFDSVICAGVIIVAGNGILTFIFKHFIYSVHLALIQTNKQRKKKIITKTTATNKFVINQQNIRKGI